MEKYGSTSISNTVIGNDRDWVFIITSLLDDRIKRIRRFSINREQFVNVLFSIFFIILSLVPLTINAALKKNSLELNQLKIIEQNYKNGKIKNPIEALIEIEKYKLDTNDTSIPMSSMAGVGIILALIIIVFATVH